MPKPYTGGGKQWGLRRYGNLFSNLVKTRKRGGEGCLIFLGTLSGIYLEEMVDGSLAYAKTREHRVGRAFLS